MRWNMGIDVQWIQDILNQRKTVQPQAASILLYADKLIFNAWVHMWLIERKSSITKSL